MASKRLLSVDFEVYGKVQGVFFRKFTNETATELGLVGWVQNTPRNTVIGTVQGEESAIQVMKEWLSNKGSPKSRIDKCNFKETQIARTTYAEFGITPGNDKKRKKKSVAGTSKSSCN